MPKPKSPKPPEHPEILLDVDGTCLDSAGKFNTNLFKALKAMGIKQANILSSFEMKKLDAYLEDKSFRCLVIDELKKTGINTGYVIVNASPYLDVDDKDQGKLGSYYRNTIEKFERRILKIRKKNPDVLDLDVTEQRKLEPPKMREQEILGIESKQREQAVLARESSGIAAPMESVAELTETQKRDNEKVERIRKKLQPKTESFVDWHKFKGGKERMILHVLQHKPSSNFIVFDDKEEVNNTVERMDVDSENFPAANGRMHAVKVDMKNRKQTEDYYIRKLIQGYSISQLKQFIETHAKELADGKELLRYLLNAIPQEEEIKEKQKGIYAQLVLAYWHPHDIENIVELYQKLSQEETISADLEGAFANVMLASLENPAFRIKILDAAIANIDENKKTPFKDYLVSDIKKTSLEHYTMLAEKDSEKWTPLVQQISENKCETTNDLLLLRSSIQLGLAMKDKQDIEN